MFDPDVRVKEEGDGDTLRQLLALETAAGAGMADDDGEVVCTGESTRLTAHMPDTNKTTTHSSQVKTQIYTRCDTYVSWHFCFMFDLAICFSRTMSMTRELQVAQTRRKRKVKVKEERQVSRVRQQRDRTQRRGYKRSATAGLLQMWAASLSGSCTLWSVCGQLVVLMMMMIGLMAL